MQDKAGHRNLSLEAMYGNAKVIVNNTYTYDAMGNMTAESRHSFEDGTKQLKETKTFGYDIIKNATSVLAAAWLKAKPSSICHVCDPPEASSQWGTLTEMNRLQEVKSDKKLLQRNTYDAEGLRTEMEENDRLIKFLYDGDGLNLYAYCHNNPVEYVDPSGHKAGHP